MHQTVAVHSPVIDDADKHRVGVAIRELRLRRQLTMVELARRSALSQPFLSQVENGRAAPSMDSLFRIATALDTTPQALFGTRSDSAASPRLVHREPDGDDRVPVLDVGPASALRLLLPGDAPFHVLEFDGLPTEFQEHWRHDGFEAVYVLGGEIEIELDGVVSHLRTGDFVSYPAQVPHRHRCVSAERARVLMIETKVDALQDTRPGSHVPAPPAPRRRRASTARTPARR